MSSRILTDTAVHLGGVGATARRQGHAEQLEKPPSSRRGNRGALDGTARGRLAGPPHKATPSPGAGDTERRGQSPRLVDPGDTGQSGAGCAQAHPRTCVRGGLPTGVVWISAQADSTRRDQASGGSNRSAEDAGPLLCTASLL